MLNWLREKLFKRPDIGTSTSDTSSETSSTKLFPTSEKVNMFSELTPKSSQNEKINLIIICEGEPWTINVDYYQDISNLTDLAVHHFFDPKEFLNQAPKYKMICITSRPKKILSPQSTVSDEQLKHGDELMLVRTISTGASVQLQLTIQDIKGPTKEAIIEATAHLPSRNPIQIVPALDCQDNFQSEIRKVLYSLIEASARILSQSPDAKVVFDSIAARINAKTKKEVDKNAVKNLKELGFTEAQSRYALRLKRNRQVEAMEWLLQNSHRVKEEDLPESSNLPSSSSTYPPPTDNPLDVIHQLLSDIQEFHLRHFEPNSDALERLIPMGFKEEDVIEALKMTGNNQVAASEWLCGERDSSLMKPEAGLNTDSSLFKALMNNPAIQLGLHNPKVMLALLSILENPSSANLWLSDVDTAPVLGHVFKTYHAEKHMENVNQQMELLRRQVR